MRRLSFAVLMVALALPGYAAARLTYVRRIPAARAVEAQYLVVASALGDTDKVATFVETFVEQANHAGSIRMGDATRGGTRYVALRRNDEVTSRLLKRYPADAYVSIGSLACRSEERQGQESSYDADRKRRRIQRHWIAATCTARVDIVGRDLERIIGYEVKGEGSSSHVETLSEEERDAAMQAAARFAAVAAVEEITPRVIRESIELDTTAPRFDEGMALIEAGRLLETRAIWEEALAEHPRSAALHFDLAAVCEALADVPGASNHYEKAVVLAPGEGRYRHEAALFRRRYGLQKQKRGPASIMP